MTKPQDDSASSDPLPGETVEGLYDRYAPQVERWVRRLAGPRFDTEDLLHDIFLVVMRRRREFRGEAKLTTWLFCITEKVVRWRRRKDAVRRFLWRTHGQATTEARASVPTPIEEVERREAHRRLYAALDRMPETYRTTLVLFALEGLSGEEVATLTGTDTNTVWVRLHRARARRACRGVARASGSGLRRASGRRSDAFPSGHPGPGDGDLVPGQHRARADLFPPFPAGRCGFGRQRPLGRGLGFCREPKRQWHGSGAHPRAASGPPMGTGFRLPTLKEVHTILTVGLILDRTFFQTSECQIAWTSSPYGGPDLSVTGYARVRDEVGMNPYNWNRLDWLRGVRCVR